jgi:hypothetical protein
MCFRIFGEDTSRVTEFLDNNPEIKNECLNLFIESPRLGIVKLQEYLDSNGLWCAMLTKKKILNEIKWKLEE